MFKSMRSWLVDVTGIAAFGIVLYMILLGGNTWGNLTDGSLTIPSSVLSLNTIFISIIVEAIPFVLIGVLIAGIIQIFITEDHIRRWMPKNRVLMILMTCVIGALFPACECGIVPIVRRLVSKGVPIFAGVAFLLTGPIINPIVILSTYMAFGNDLKIAMLRMLLGFVVAFIVALIISLFYKDSQLKREHGKIHQNTVAKKAPLLRRFKQMLEHSVDEFFDMGKYLIIGAFLAAFVQTYVSSSVLLELGSGVISSTLVMMGLAFLLSLCSEADAFIASSFRNIFSTTSLLGFLVYGPMLDLKNMLMMMGVFRFKFVLVLMALITIVVFGSVMVVHMFL